MASDAQVRESFPNSVLVVLAQALDPKSSIITLQDYSRNGRLFVPVFRSQESFDQATRGGVKNPICQIDRRLLVSILRGPETIVLDAGLPDALEISGEDLKRVFPERIDLVAK